MWKLRAKVETEEVQGLSITLIGPGEGGWRGEISHRTLLSITIIKWRFALYVIKT